MPPNRKKQLAIVQSRETQFDAPLYRRIHEACIFNLQLIYTASSTDEENLDCELGFPPVWDHLSDHAYSQHTLRLTTLRAIWNLSRKLRGERPALVVICGYYPRSHLLLAILLRLFGQRIGLRSDNTLAHTQFRGLRGRLRRVVVGWIQRLFHTWHPVGDQSLAYLRKLSGSQRPSYRFAYAVDNDWFARESADARLERPAFLEARGWPGDAFVVLGIIKFTPREDPLTLVEGFRQLHGRCSRARLILIGDGPLRHAVAAACAPLGIAVHCPGYVPYSQLPLWYGFADVFVHPAPDEPWGVSVNEALACGLPVVAASGVGAAKELITPGLCGSVFATGDAAELAAQLEALAAMPDARSQLAPACHAASDHWHYRHTIRAFEQALAVC